MDEELKACPCPFCGDTPGEDAHTLTDGGFKYGAIQCGCGAIGPDVRTDYKDWPHWKDAAIREWNTRAQLPSQGGEAVVAPTHAPTVERCDTCHDQGEIWSGENAYQGQFHPLEPIMLPCPECSGRAVEPSHSDSVSVPRELAARIADPFTSTSNLIENLRDLRALLNGGRE